MTVFYTLSSKGNKKKHPMKLKILIIDDDTDILTSLKFSLEQTYPGINITTAETGKIGLDSIKDNGYNLILLDLVMENMNGAQVLRKIREMPKDYSVVIMTAHAKDPLIEEVQKIGYDEFLNKPFTMKQLIPIIYKVIPGSKYVPKKNISC